MCAIVMVWCSEDNMWESVCFLPLFIMRMNSDLQISWQVPDLLSHLASPLFFLEKIQEV